MSSPAYIPAPALLKLLRAQVSKPLSARPLLVYDVRDDDYAGGHLAQAVHVASDTFMRNAQRLAADVAAEKAGTSALETIAFHCTFSQVRGPRAAARFREALRMKGVEGVEVVVVEGGFKACAKLYGEDTKDLFQDFNRDVHSSYWDDV